jgi:glycosyltransferase involved in cell wall biosynthesis
VIGTNAGGIPEALQDGETGILIDKPEIEFCTSALKSLVQNRERSQAMAEKGREFVLKNYSYQRTIQLQKELYQSLIN